MKTEGDCWSKQEVAQSAEVIIPQLLQWRTYDVAVKLS